MSSPHQLTIYTDHANLQYYRHPQRLSQRVARVLGELADYYFILVYKSGVTNHADHLSQRPDYDTGVHDNENETVLPGQLFANVLTSLNLDQQVYDEQQRQPSKMQCLQKEFPLNQVKGHFLHCGRPVVPAKENLQREILQQYHDHVMAGHPGITNTLHTMLHDYWWPACKQFVTAYV